jgi:hypothetical protein
MTSVISFDQSHDSGDYARVLSEQHTPDYVQVYGGPLCSSMLQAWKR